MAILTNAGDKLTAVFICISLIISGVQGAFLNSQCHPIVTGAIFTWLILGGKCDDVAVSHLVMSNSFPPTGCSPSGSSLHGVFEARILEWVVMHSFRGSS